MEKGPTLSEMFPLPNEAKRLQLFIGDWKVEGTLAFEGEPHKVKGSWKFESGAAGWGVQARMKMKVEGMGDYEEIDMAGFDQSDGLVHIFSITNTAATHDHKGKWADDNTLTVVYEGLQEGKKYREDVTIKFRSPKETAIHEVDTLGDQILSTMDVTLRKQLS